MAGRKRVRQHHDADGNREQRRPHRLGNEQVGDAFDVGRHPATFRDDLGLLRQTDALRMVEEVGRVVPLLDLL